MLRRGLKIASAGIVVLALAGGLLYQFAGLRVVLDGGGQPTLRFVTPRERQADEIARHRQAQRAQPPAPPVQAEPPAQTPRPLHDALRAAETATPHAPSEPTLFWTDFRGPQRDGVYRTGSVRTNWPAAGLTPVWKQPVGGGYASFVVAGGRAFTIEQRGAEEVVTAYDVASGRELWTNGWTALFSEFMGGDGPRATPTWAEGRLYALGAAGEFRAIDASTGRTLWRTNILEENGAANLSWGMAAAPLVFGDTVIVLPGGRDGASVVAYDRRSGRRVWSALDDQAGYASPMLVTLGGMRQLLVFTATRLVGLTPEGGELLWEYPWRTMSDINAAQPIVIGDNRVFLSSGYGTGAAVIEITPDGGRFAVREVWRNTRMKNRFASSVLYQGTIYGLDESILAAVDAGTGEQRWKAGRYGYGQVMLASGHLIVLTEDGDIALVRATPERHDELVRFPVLEGKTWNHPALAGGYLLVRNLAEMAAFDLRP